MCYLPEYAQLRHWDSSAPNVMFGLIGNFILATWGKKVACGSLRKRKENQKFSLHS